MEKKLKSWQGWLLFGGSMVVVFVLGLCVSALMERRAELESVFNNRRTVITGIEARNEVFKSDFPREYQTWTETAKTDFQSEFNGNIAVDVLEQRPEMVVLWAGYAFSKDYSTPRGHMHAIEDITASLRTGAPATPEDGPQPSTCWTCKSPDVPRMMEAIGVDAFYNNKWGAMGDEIVNPIGCADCHEPENMNLHISRPALIEAFARQGRDITKATPQEMRSLVCALALEIIFHVALRANQGTHLLLGRFRDVLALTLESLDQSRATDMQVHILRLMAIGATDRIHDLFTQRSPFALIEIIHAHRLHHTGNIRAFTSPASSRLRPLVLCHRSAYTQRVTHILDRMHMPSRGRIILRESVTSPKDHHFRTSLQHIDRLIPVV